MNSVPPAASALEVLPSGTLTHLAALYFRTGRYDESERLYRQALAAGHPEFTALAEAGLADIQRRKGS